MRRRLFLLLTMAMAMSGCEFKSGSYARDRAAAEAAADKFHQLWNQGKLVELYALTSAQLKSNQPESQFIAAVEQTTGALGKIKQSWQLRASCAPNQVRFAYRTDFENGRVTEMMLWEIRGDKAELLMYQIQQGDVDADKLPVGNCSKS